MKRMIIAAVLALAFAWTASAQVKSVGVRGGYGLEASIQQWFGYSSPQFVEVDLGMDLLQDHGFKLTGTYNWIVSNPSIAGSGAWDLYMGPGVSLGYVYDTPGTRNDDRPSLMAAFVVQFGMEFYLFQHFGVSVDVRPMIGYHFGAHDLYRGGLYGFIPSLALRYEF